MAISKQRIGEEISLLSNELSERYSLVWVQKGTNRFRFVAAQVSLCIYFMNITKDENNDWGWFPYFLEQCREEALCEYREARQDDDQAVALLKLARLRLATTLARRLADTRRHSFFIKEIPAPDPEWEMMREQNLWIRELTLMMEESLANHQRVEPHGNYVRTRMAAAQVCLLSEMFRITNESEDWSGFKDTVYDYIDSETERYEDARFEDDYDNASVMLARVRAAKTLARRLDNPERQTWLTQIFRASETKH